MYRSAGLFSLASDGNRLIAAASVNATTGNLFYVQTDGSNLEVRVRQADLGLTPNSPVRFIVTLLNGEEPYRSDEFIGVGAVGGGNLDKKTVALTGGDFLTYVPGVAAVAAEGDGL